MVNIITGKRIKQRRKELGLSADAVAKKIGKDRATLYRYENGDIENLPLSLLPLLADILDTSQAYLMGWEDSSTPQNSPQSNNKSEQDRKSALLDSINNIIGIENAISFNVDELTEEDLELLRDSIQGDIQTIEKRIQRRNNKNE